MYLQTLTKVPLPANLCDKIIDNRRPRHGEHLQLDCHLRLSLGHFQGKGASCAFLDLKRSVTRVAKSDLDSTDTYIATKN